MSKCANLFIELLNARDFQYQVADGKDGDIIVSFPYKGKDVRMFFSGEDGKYLSLYLLYENAPEDRIAEAVFVCNELNMRYKWITFFVDTDRDIMLHDDAILSFESAAEESFELLARMITISDEIKPDVMKALYG